ncbi:BLUF domain-containing protein [Acinetobacter sp.]|uniref:BLUF domain-containing protein n=1 Tax=Acinetobacter sp. TaxID=472 RepID=UPI00388F0757
MCYASKKTSNDETILKDLRDILSEARDFNTQYQIHGVLYYADGYFFQCLEGEEKHIRMLLEKLEKDSRHHAIVLLKACAVKEGNFYNWSMKYVARNSGIQNYFKSLGYHCFTPTELNEESLEVFLSFLYNVQHSVA